MWQSWCIATWSRPTPSQSFSSLTETPVSSLKTVNLYLLLSIVFYCWCLTLPCDLDLWPLTLNIYLWLMTLMFVCLRYDKLHIKRIHDDDDDVISSVSPVTCKTLYHIWAKSNNPSRQSYCDLIKLTLWPWTRVTCSAMM